MFKAFVSLQPKYNFFVGLLNNRPITILEINCIFQKQTKKLKKLLIYGKTHLLSGRLQHEEIQAANLHQGKEINGKTSEANFVLNTRAKERNQSSRI